MAMMTSYESDHTVWMREWLKQHPRETEEQQRGRALWWDKPALDLDTMRRVAESHVPRKSYYYDID